ncbi:MAG: LysR family transcriptional regulator [Gammaproteobacteria bacterium]|nr:LysR family transcriptional regulator [Gammaproteobacteria bacterium]MBU1443405.1 LysR family transcriptional regulator [Gammaproteobacteria bacterium]MBU2286777.1 LysR family transcriptional regulator [Gammaproteobacteria bacterium]MBU2410216.1 LysR family transcriptional regulator [Gammaproteobacteria bacterium]
MDLRALRYFVAIAEAGSFTAAAERVCVAQSALSRHIRVLEDDLGVALIRRLPRGVRLTPAGVALYDSATKILDEASRIRGHLSDGGPHAEAMVTLGTSPTLGRVLVPGLYERCQRSPTGIKLSVREAFTPVLLDWLHRGLIDVAVVTSPETDKPFALQPLVGEPFALVSPLAQKRGAVITPEQLSAVPVLISKLHRGIVERQLAALGATLQVQAEIDSIDSIRELVLRGSGATLMPVSVFASDARALRSVTFSEVSGIPLSRILMLATRTELRPAAGIAVMKELVQAEFAELARRGVFSLGAGRRTQRATERQMPAR